MPRIGTGWRRRRRWSLLAGACLTWLAGPALAAGPDCSRHRTDELTCLACNIYHEARNQPMEGQRAVAMVTLNRLASPDYPDTVCGVVWEQGRDRRTGRLVAQFSWTLDGRPDLVTEPAAWTTARRLAAEALAGQGPVRDPSLGALFFHADYVQPDWRHDPGMTLVARIGDHLFYDRKGEAVPRRSSWGARARALVRPTAPEPGEEQPSTLPAAHPGAKRISLRPGGGGLLQVTVVEDGRVRRMKVARE